MIADILGRGKEAAKTSRDICSLLGIELRVLTNAIMNERRKGAPICSITSGETRGYFLAANKGEMLHLCGSLHRRAREIDETREACMRTLDDLPE